MGLVTGSGGKAFLYMVEGCVLRKKEHLLALLPGFCWRGVGRHKLQNQFMGALAQHLGQG